jgi:hypothetical protein
LLKKLVLLLPLLFVGSLAHAQAPVSSCPSSQGSCKYNHISTNATTVVKSGAGVVHSITINTKGASANIATVYDNTAGSGTVIAIIDTTGNVGTIILDVGFYTGLTVVTATGTSADITVSYR